MAGSSDQTGMGRARPARAGASKGLFETARPGGLHQRVHRSLSHAIASGKFERGARLPSEAELAATFGVSRPVVRQALDILRRDGLIESQRGSGNYVRGGEEAPAAVAASTSFSPVQMQHLLDDLEFREVIEPEAAYFAARRRTPADMERMEAAMRRFEDAHAAGAITHHFDYLFHESIALATTNGHFVDAVRSLEYRPGDARLQMRHLIHFLPSHRGAAVLREHGEVLALIRERDADGARSAMWKHIDAARLRLIDFITASGAGAATGRRQG